MQLTTILFDLDGTLLPMDQDKFIEIYFGSLVKKLVPYGYEPNKLIQSVMQGTAAMVKNNGEKTNEEVFWSLFSENYSQAYKKDEDLFEEYYKENFVQTKASCGFNSKAAEAVRALKAKGYRVALATNPIFPRIATEQRIRWAGLEPSDFELVTAYEQSSSCKPNPAYYKEILGKLGVSGEECLMVGNDAVEDVAATGVGMKVFLIPDCLLNKKKVDLSAYPQGDFDGLLGYVEELNK